MPVSMLSRFPKLMSASPSWTLCRSLSRRAFEELCSLWQQLQVKAGNRGRILSEQISPVSGQPPRAMTDRMGRFRLLVTPDLTVLLTGELEESNSTYKVIVTCDSQEIEVFIEKFQLYDRLAMPLPVASDEDPPLTSPEDLHGYLISQMIDIIARDTPSPVLAVSPRLDSRSPDEVLLQQIAQEQLLNRVIAQIHQSLELSTILETAVREVRAILQVDRLVIYQFKSQKSSDSDKSFKRMGLIAYESRIGNAIPSLLNLSAEEDCFTRVSHYQEKFQKGTIVAVDDVESTYSSSFCLIEFLQEYWIRSKLVAPIRVGGELWGLVIAHQCFKKRQWLESETTFLGKIGDHLAVAIFQAQLYAQVQQQKNSFEQRVVERTQELRDTLIAASAANQSKSTFLGNMSHELRTPLTCIIGLSGTLLRCVGEPKVLPIQKQQQYLQIIQDSGKHLLEIIDDILEYSQLEAGKIVLNVREISLHQFALRVTHSFIEEAEKKNIQLTLDFRVADTADLFWADPDRLYQILLHLIHNGIKFTPNGGSIILRIWREQNIAVFQLEDTGIGISDHQFPLLFKQFQQLEKSLDRTYGGTGLGLALTKQLVELHGGIIEVESSVGQGSSFTVRLPNQYPKILSKKAAKSKTRGKEPVFAANRSVVLLVREEQIATLLCELLTAANYQVIWLTDDTPSLRRLELLNPILAIIDKEKLASYPLGQLLKKSPILRSLKILVLSERIGTEEWQKLQAEGIDDYLIEPIQPNLLLQRINALLAERLNEKTIESDR